MKNETFDTQSYPLTSNAVSFFFHFAQKCVVQFDENRNNNSVDRQQAFFFPIKCQNMINKDKKIIEK